MWGCNYLLQQVTREWKQVISLTVDWKQDTFTDILGEKPPPRKKESNPMVSGQRLAGRRGRGCRREAALTPRAGAVCLARRGSVKASRDRRATPTLWGAGSPSNSRDPKSPWKALAGAHPVRTQGAELGTGAFGLDRNLRAEDTFCRKQAHKA